MRQQLGPITGRSADTAISKQFELFHDFTTKANGAVGAKADSGQTWQLNYSSGRTLASPTVASGRFVNADTAQSGSYLTAQISGSVSYLEGVFNWGSGTTTGFGAVGLIAWASLAAVPFVTIPDSPCHLSIANNQYQYGVATAGAITNLAPVGATATATTVYFPTVATTPVRVQVYIDKANSCAYVRGPDGAVNKFSHALIGSTTATYAGWETTNTNTSTDKDPQIAQVAADSVTIGSQKEALDKAQQIKNDYYTQNIGTQVYRSGGNIVIDPNYTDDAVNAGNLGVNTVRSGLTARQITAAGNPALDALELTHDVSGDRVNVPTTPGRVIFMSFAIQKDAANTGTTQPLYLQPRSIDSAGTETPLATVTITPSTGITTGTWTTYSAYGVMPAGAETYHVPIYIDSTIPVGDKFYIRQGVVQDVTESYNIMIGAQAINAKLAAGSTTVPPTWFQSGTNLTTPLAGAMEFDGAALYGTHNATSGRGMNNIDHMFRLSADAGAAIGATIADYFGTNSAFPYVAAGIYEIVWYLFYTKTTAGTVVYTITSTTAPVSVSAFYTQTPIAGIGTAGTAQTAAISKSTATGAALPATGSLTTAVQHQAEVHALYVANATTAGNLRLRVTESAGTITPLRDSFYRVRKLPAGNVGTFVA